MIVHIDKARAKMKRACVIGHPISHSKSPHLHSYWLRHYNLTGAYLSQDVAPDDLEVFVDKIREGQFVGCNVTLPHKENIMAHVNQLTMAAKRIGAVNTVWQEEGQIWGGNSDGYGFIAHLRQQAPHFLHKCELAIILGAGGAARAVIDALAGEGVGHIVILNRDLMKAAKLVDHFQNHWSNTGFSVDSYSQWDDYVSRAGLIVNTTSLGMAGQPPLEVNLAECASHCVIYDLVYNPLTTEFLQQAQNLNLKSVDGLGMLLHQGCVGFEKWFGIFPEVTNTLREYMLSR